MHIVMKIGQNVPAQGKLLQMEAIEATVRYKAVLLLTVDLRGFQGNGSKYGRLRGNV